MTQKSIQFVATSRTVQNYPFPEYGGDLVGVVDLLFVAELLPVISGYGLMTSLDFRLVPHFPYGYQHTSWSAQSP